MCVFKYIFRLFIWPTRRAWFVIPRRTNRSASWWERVAPDWRSWVRECSTFRCRRENTARYVPIFLHLSPKCFRINCLVFVYWRRFVIVVRVGARRSGRHAPLHDAQERVGAQSQAAESWSCDVAKTNLADWPNHRFVDEIQKQTKTGEKQQKSPQKQTIKTQ